MTPPPDLTSYRLSASESQHIFSLQILPLEIASLPASPTPKAPVAILVVGQTGAGKTRLCPEILSALTASKRKPVHLIADVYKIHHPAYATIPTHLASAATGPDARVWLSMAVEEASKRRLDILIESACRHPSDFISLVSLLHVSSYHVIIIVLAVPSPLSRLGILTRYYRKLPEARSGSLPLRLTPAKVHDDSYEGLLKAAEWLDETETADQVVVVRRGNLLACSRAKSKGRINGIAEAVRSERKRPLSESERDSAIADLKGLSLFPQEIEQVVQIKELLNPLIVDSIEAEHVHLPVLNRLKFGEATKHDDKDILFMRFPDSELENTLSLINE